MSLAKRIHQNPGKAHRKVAAEWTLSRFNAKYKYKTIRKRGKIVRAPKLEIDFETYLTLEEFYGRLPEYIVISEEVPGDE